MSGCAQNGNDKQQQSNPKKDLSPSKLRQKLIKSYRIKVLGMGTKRDEEEVDDWEGEWLERESDARMLRNHGHKIGHEYTTRRDESNLQAI